MAMAISSTEGVMVVPGATSGSITEEAMESVDGWIIASPEMIGFWRLAAIERTDGSITTGNAVKMSGALITACISNGLTGNTTSGVGVWRLAEMERTDAANTASPEIVGFCKAALIESTDGSSLASFTILGT
jgi:hypothetical protein